MATARYRNSLETQAQQAALGGEKDVGAEFTIDRKFGKGFDRGELEELRVRAYYPPTRRMYRATNFVRGLSWADASDQAAVSASIELDNGDGQVGRLLNRPGMIFFVEGRGKRGGFREITRLVAWDTEATDLMAGTVTLQLYDFLVYLQIATGNFHYTKDKQHKKGWTAHEIALDIIKRYKIPVARLKGKARIARTQERFDRFVLRKKSVYEALAMAYTLDTRKSGRSYFIESIHGRLAIVRKKRSMVLVVTGQSNLRAATLRRSLTDRYGSVSLEGSSQGTASGGGPILYIGDSLGVGTAPKLKKLVKVSMDVDVKESRPSSTGVSLLRSKLKSKHKVVVFDLGTNNREAAAYRKDLNAAHRLCKGRTLVLATMNASWIGPINNVARDFANSKSNVVLVDWRQASQQDNYLGNDGIHATDAGYTKRARMFQAVVGRGTHKTGPEKPKKAHGAPTAAQKRRAREQREKAQRAARRNRLHGEPGSKKAPSGEARLATDTLFGTLNYKPNRKMPVIDPDYTRANAQALADKLSRAKKEFSFTADGNFLIKQGSRIFARVAFARDVSGKPLFFRKELFVESVTHSIAPGDYSMDVTCAWRERAVSVNVDPQEATQRPQPRDGGGGDDVTARGHYDMASLEELATSVGMANPHLMAAIAMAESGGDPTIYNGICCTGLWQINWPVHQGRFPGKDPKDPIDNARMAASILKSQGLGAWEVYTNGMYQSFM